MVRLNHEVLSGYGFVTTLPFAAACKDLNQKDRPQGRFGRHGSDNGYLIIITPFNLTENHRVAKIKTIHFFHTD